MMRPRRHHILNFVFASAILCLCTVTAQAATNSTSKGTHLKQPSASVPANPAANPPAKALEGCVMGNCQSGSGTFVNPNGTRYTGTFQLGRPHGTGIMVYSKGGRYVGGMKNGLRNGWGTYFFSNGDTFTGPYVNNKRLGVGIYTFASGASYMGNYTRGQRDGVGKRISSSGDVDYQLWKGGKKVRSLSRTEYLKLGGASVDVLGGSAAREVAKTTPKRKPTPTLGCISGDCKNGFGTFVWKDGDRYVGNYKNGKRNGRGSYYWINGDRFMGEYLNGKRNGKGLYLFADGRRFQGQYLNGKRHGVAEYTNREGTVMHARFKDDVKVAAITEEEFRKEFGIGAKLKKKTGCISGDCKDGFGTYVWSDGDRYVGNYRNGKRNGAGTYYWKNGDTFSGIYSDGKRFGQGVYTFSNGNRYEGMYRNSKRDGLGIYYKNNGETKYYNYSMGTVIETLTKERYMEMLVDQPPSGSLAKAPKSGNRTAVKPSDPTGFDSASSTCESGNCKQGKGVMRMADGSRYDGEFANGKPEGKGVLTYANGDRFEGNFKKGLRQGKGTLFYSEGGRYMGLFKDDRRHGPGRDIKVNGRVFYRLYKGGRLERDLTYNEYMNMD